MVHLIEDLPLIPEDEDEDYSDDDDENDDQDQSSDTDSSPEDMLLNVGDFFPRINYFFYFISSWPVIFSFG